MPKPFPPPSMAATFPPGNDTPKLWVAADTQAWLRLPADQRYGPVVLAYTKRSDKHCVPLYFNGQSDTSAPPAQPSKVVAANCMEGICGGPSPSPPSQESPQEPTRAMLDAARDWSNKKYGKAIGDDAARGCWQAMLAALSSSSLSREPGREPHQSVAESAARWPFTCPPSQLADRLAEAYRFFGEMLPAVRNVFIEGGSVGLNRNPPIHVAPSPAKAVEPESPGVVAALAELVTRLESANAEVDCFNVAEALRIARALKNDLEKRHAERVPVAWHIGPIFKLGSEKPGRFGADDSQWQPLYSADTIAALKKDAERLDWLDKHPREATIRVGTDMKACVFYGVSCDPKWTMREAIDAAIDAAQTSKKNG